MNLANLEADVMTVELEGRGSSSVELYTAEDSRNLMIGISAAPCLHVNISGVFP